MKICKVCKQAHYGSGNICPICGGELLDTDAARANAAATMGKYEQSDSKFGKFMKSVAKMTFKAADIIDKKYK